MPHALEQRAYLQSGHCRAQRATNTVNETEKTLREVVWRLDSTFHPQELRLFGSRADGRAAHDSDCDIVDGSSMTTSQTTSSMVVTCTPHCSNLASVATSSHADGANLIPF
jgi:hypothetical protein